MASAILAAVFFIVSKIYGRMEGVCYNLKLEINFRRIVVNKGISAVLLFLCSAASAMESTPIEVCDIYVRRYIACSTRAECEELAAEMGFPLPNGKLFSTIPLKNKSEYELRNDAPAATALKFFHDRNFAEFMDYLEPNKQNMLPDNADKLEDLLFTSFPAIFFKDWKDEVFKERVISFVLRAPDFFLRKGDQDKGEEENIYKYEPKYPRFCYECLICVMVDSIGDNMKLYEASQRTCKGMVEKCDWPEKEEEQDLLQIEGLHESFIAWGVSNLEAVAARKMKKIAAQKMKESSSEE
jgi:hypothetical protein